MAIRFDLCERTATRLLLDQDIQRPNINVSRLNFDKDVMFDTFVNYCIQSGINVESFMKRNMLKDGFLVKYGDTHLILSKGFACTPRQNWTWAHEIGHVYLGHEMDGTTEEIEAHHFASQLLIPECVVRYIASCRQCMNTFDIAEIFGVSLAAATNRVKSLKKKQYFQYSKADLALLDRYKPLLRDYIQNAV